MSNIEFDPTNIEVEEYDLGGETHAAAPFTVFIVSPKTTTVTVTTAATNDDTETDDEAGI